MNQVNTAPGAGAEGAGTAGASVDSTGTMSTARLSELRDEVTKLKVTGGAANPERLAGKWGIGLTIVGFVITILSWSSALELRRPRNQSPFDHLRVDRRDRLGRRHRDLAAQLDHALPALLDHPPRLRAARADRPPHRSAGAPRQLARRCGAGSLRAEAHDAEREAALEHGRAHRGEIGDEAELDAGGRVALEEVADGGDGYRHDSFVRDPLAFGLGPWRERRGIERVFVERARADRARAMRAARRAAVRRRC